MNGLTCSLATSATSVVDIASPFEASQRNSGRRLPRALGILSRLASLRILPVPCYRIGTVEGCAHLLPRQQVPRPILLQFSC